MDRWVKGWVKPVLLLGVLACGDNGTDPTPEPLASVTVEPVTVQMLPGDTIRFQAVARSANGAPLSGHPFVWTSSRAQVASVDSTGLVTGMRAGTATISAGTSGRSASGAVTVQAPTPVPVASVEVEPGDAEISAGDTLRYSATARDADGEVLTGRDASWSVEPAAHASIGETGLLRALSEGAFTVTATVGGISGSTDGSVRGPAPAPTPILSSLEPDRIQAGWDDFTLVVRGEGFPSGARVLWDGIALETFFVSAMELHATVSADYLRRARDVEVTIDTPPPNPRLSNMKPFTISEPPALSVVSRVAGNAVFVGDRVRLDAIALNQFGEEIEDKTLTWTTSDTTVARVEAGWLRALRVGSIDLTVHASPVSTTLPFRVVEVPASEVVFESWSSGGPELFGRDLDPLGAPRRLLPPHLTGRQASVSADGSRVAFVGSDAFGNEDIYTVDRDGSGLVRLTQAAGIDDQPAWSPDGSMIAFRSFREGKSDIWVMDATGDDPRNLTYQAVFLPEEYNDRPAWAPAGDRLAFSRGFGVTRGLYVVGLDGSEPVELASEAGRNLLEPSWSPDGEIVAFRRHDQATNTSSIAFTSGEPGGGAADYFWYPPQGSITPVMLPGSWVVVDAPALPGGGTRTVAFVHLTTGAIVMPLAHDPGPQSEPRVVR